MRREITEFLKKEKEDEKLLHDAKRRAENVLRDIAKEI
jgi:ribosome recycling factor